MVGSPHIHMLLREGGGIRRRAPSRDLVEEHTLNLMPGAPLSIMFLSLWTEANTHTHVQMHTRAFAEARLPGTSCCSVVCSGQGGDWVACRALKKSDVQCIYYA